MSANRAPEASWSGLLRRYPPLVAVVVALLLAVFALPSALNLPQANPGQSLEYAPVPGDSGQPVGGNIAGLGLGSGSTGPGSGAPGSAGGGLDGGLQPQGSQASTKQCVGNPPRQTEDPLSPPCVAYFQGDNHCATDIGVSCSEFRVLMYWEGGQQASFCDNQPTPIGQLYDLNNPPGPNESCKVWMPRIWATYFNSRYQLYNRHVHFYVYFSNDVNGEPATERQAEAADNFAAVHPFAVIPEVAGNENAYEGYMAKHGVMIFTDVPFVGADVYQQYAGLAWGYSPSLEEQADSLASYICQKIVQPGKVSFAGSFPPNTPRRFGLIRDAAIDNPTLRAFQDATVARMHSLCGFTPTDQAEYPVSWAVNYTGPRQQEFETYGPRDMATFFKDKITTIIEPGGLEYQYSPAAKKLNYVPEWVLGGDGFSDANEAVSQEDQTEWAHAIVATPQVYIGGDGNPADCEYAWKTVHTGDTNQAVAWACVFYNSLRQLFTGVQLSGPVLNASNTEEGFRAIPPKRSSSPSVPACYYDPGDYTCVKDATAEWWDPNATNSTGTPPQGCYRMMQNGARYLRGAWPPGDAMAQKNASTDPCNLFDGGLDAISISST